MIIVSFVVKWNKSFAAIPQTNLFSDANFVSLASCRRVRSFVGVAHKLNQRLVQLLLSQSRPVNCHPRSPFVRRFEVSSCDCFGMFQSVTFFARRAVINFGIVQTWGFGTSLDVTTACLCKAQNKREPFVGVRVKVLSASGRKIQRTFLGPVLAGEFPSAIRILCFLSVTIVVKREVHDRFDLCQRCWHFLLDVAFAPGS